MRAALVMVIYLTSCNVYCTRGARNLLSLPLSKRRLHKWIEASSSSIIGFELSFFYAECPLSINGHNGLRASWADIQLIISEDNVRTYSCSTPEKIIVSSAINIAPTRFEQTNQPFHKLSSWNLYHWSRNLLCLQRGWVVRIPVLGLRVHCNSMLQILNGQRAGSRQFNMLVPPRLHLPDKSTVPACLNNLELGRTFPIAPNFEIDLVRMRDCVYGANIKLAMWRAGPR